MASHLRFIRGLAVGLMLGVAVCQLAWYAWPRSEPAPTVADEPAPVPVEAAVAAQDMQAQLAVLLLTALQGAPPPVGGGQPAAGAADEAGAEFWKAARAAREGKFQAAIEALDRAKALHNQRRFARLKQAQNPDSDPLEEIFLRACDEIREYWLVRERLGEGGYKFAKSGDVANAIKELLDKRKEAAALPMLVELLTKEKYDVKGPAEVLDGVKKLVQDKKTGEDNLKKTETKLKDAMKAADDNDARAKDFMAKLQDTEKKLAGANGELKNIGDALAAAGIAKKAPVAGIEDLAAERNKANGLVDVVNRKLKEAKLLPGNAGRTDVVGGVDRALVEATSPLITALGRIAGNVAQAGGSMNDVVVQLYDLADSLNRQAVEEVQRAEREKAAAEEARAVSLFRQALALREQGNITAARSALEQALKLGGSRNASWRVVARETLAELSDPQAYYLPRAEALRADGKLKEALDLLNQALKHFAKEQQAVLTAERSLVHLALAAAEAGGKKLTPASAHISDAQRDAEVAYASGARAEGYYAAGRIAEELGNWKEAEGNFLKAVEAHPAPDRAGTRYALALQRVRLQLP